MVMNKRVSIDFVPLICQKCSVASVALFFPFRRKTARIISLCVLFILIVLQVRAAI